MAKTAGGRLDAFVFDLDGVFRDSKVDLDECYKESFQAHGLSYPFTPDFSWRLRAFDPFFKMSLCFPALYALAKEKTKTGNARAYFENPNWKPELLALMRQRPLPKPLYEKMLDSCRDAVAAHHSPAVPGSIAALRALHGRGYKLGIFSHETTPLAWRWLKEHGVDDLFSPESVVGIGEGGATHKPDPTGLLKACTHLGVPPSRAAFVGDSQADVLCAKNAGALAVGITTGMATRDDLLAVKPDLVVDSVDELLSL